MNWTNSRPRNAKVFSQYSDDFFLDETNTLRKKDIPKDDQAVIDSYFSTRLESILDMYSEILDMPQRYQVDFDPAIVEVDQRRSDLERLLDADRIIESYRSSDPANADLSRSDLVQKMRDKYMESVKAIQAQRGEKNETQNQQKIEQKNVHEDSVHSEE